MRADNAIVQQTFTISNALQTYEFSIEFIGIVSLRWSQLQADANKHQFDNLHLNTQAVAAVPLPAGAWLLVTALLTLVRVVRPRAS